MVQKMPIKLAHAVIKYGFGVLPVSEKGLFGQGIYFTDSLDYLDILNPGEGEKTCYLVSMVAPGNPYPVVEKLRGSPCRSGYQSHLTLVYRNPENFGTFIDLDNPDLADKPIASEMVLFDSSNALPLFILEDGGSSSQAQVSPQPKTKRNEWLLAHPNPSFGNFLLTLVKGGEERENQKWLARNGT